MIKLTTQTPQQSLSSEIIRLRPEEADFNRFKETLDHLLQKIDEADREKNQENHIRDFLLNSFYKTQNEVNGKNDIDLVIHEGKTSQDKVAVILETKRPKSKEMISADNPNNKAFYQAILYFLRERADENNINLKFVIVTNIKEWFIFRAADFNRLFYDNAKFRRQYEDWKNNKLINQNTKLFYDEVAKPFVENLDENVTCTHFNIKNYEKANEADLIALYKIFSPFHLLKKPFENDSNALDKNFYTELLHIIGLEETKEKNKTLIKRKAKPDNGSLLEKAIAKIESKFSRFDQKKMFEFGATRSEQIYNIALELCIVWTNRVLFLKLLESQLVAYHENDADYRFLNTKTINNFGELYVLFHDVLNKTIALRDASVKAKYACVPYLNSSLFDFADVENLTITVDELDNNINLSLPNASILRKIGETDKDLPTLEYLFRFLDAYDFASEGKEDVQQENRSLINASVLGKVFEKINGYKDGSIYTPGFITMYMCRQAIRLAVVQKFKDEYDLDIETFGELYNHITRFDKPEKILEFNALINDLKLCDPAVGSGHFLVSALNEILAIKSELEIFANTDGRRFSQYKIAVANDEIIVTNRDDNRPFRYTVRNGKPLTDEMQNLQRALFHEKQLLIENCLFGVDINPNSVKICRLRLWIELLKNAYYKPFGNLPVNAVFPLGEYSINGQISEFAELETLPNIDINIKQGNSLLSRYGLRDKFRTEKTTELISEYRSLVDEQKNVKDKNRRDELKLLVRNLRKALSSTLNDEAIAIKKELDRNYYGLNEIYKPALIEKRSEAEREIASRRFKKKIAELEKEIADVDKKYDNAFEWRFEFPEVLDDGGNFLGFDIVIGNPPYGFRNVLTADEKSFYRKEKKLNFSSGDVAELFIVVARNFVKANGIFTFIIPKKSLYGESWKSVREYWLSQDLRFLIDTSKAFESVLLEMNAFLLFSRENKNSEITVGTVEYKATEINFFGTFPFREIFTADLSNAQIYRGSYPKSLLQRVSEKSFREKVIKAEIGISNITSHLTFEGENNYPCIKGFDIEKYGLKEPIRYLKGNIAKPFVEKYSHEKIIAQEIVAHIQNPVPHILITALLDDGKRLFNDTCAEIVLLNSNLNQKFLLAYLQSKFCNWYCYNLIYNRAIRTMHFIDYYVSQIPIPKISPEAQTPFIKLVDEILELKKRGENTDEQENKIDEMVYDLYDLDKDEREIVSGKA